MHPTESPLIISNTETMNSIVDLVKQALLLRNQNEDIAKIEEKINNEVYKIYGLSDSEVQSVMTKLNLRD